VENIKIAYNPKAFLQQTRNVKCGLKTRTSILNLLEKQPQTAASMARKTGLSYSAVGHHLRLLEAEGTVSRNGKKPCIWNMSGLGQKRLIV
jgi:predicted transcriptional regulator